jgi:hypothetical protein
MKNENLLSGVLKHLHLKLNVTYMIMQNINLEDGIVNGTTGFLRKVTLVNNEPVFIWLEFDDTSVGKLTRLSNKKLVEKEKVSEKNWTPFPKSIFNVQLEEKSNLLCTRKQFPVIPAEAITICKCQGSSYQNAVSNIDKGMRISEYYVSWSRTTTLEGLEIVGDIDFNTLCIRDPEILKVDKEYQRLRDKSLLEFNLNYLDNIDHSVFKIVYHNVQSLHKNYEFVKNDYFMKNSDLIFLSETWTLSNEIYELDDFDCVQRTDCSKKIRYAFGNITYAKKSSKFHTELIHNLVFVQSEEKNKYVTICCFRYQNIYLLSIYKSPNATSLFFVCQLREVVDGLLKLDQNASFLLYGDFNIDNAENKLPQNLVKFLSEYHFINTIKQIQASTNFNTQIDLCFNSENIKNRVEAGYFESLYSYHKPIWILIKPVDYNKTIFNHSSRPSTKIDLNNVDQSGLNLILNEKLDKRSLSNLSNLSTNSPKKIAQIDHKSSIINKKPYYIQFSNKSLTNCYLNSVIQSLFSCEDDLFNMVCLIISHNIFI